MRGRILGAALLVGTAAAPAAANEASEAMLQGFVRSIDQLPDWSATAASIRSDGADTLAEGLAITRDNPKVSVEIGELRLRDLLEAAKGGFTAGAVQLKGGHVTAEALDFAVPDASVQDLAAPAVAGVTFDPHHLMTFLGQVYSIAARTEFSSLSVPEMTSMQSQPGMGGDPPLTVRAVYRNLTSTGLKDGVLARSEIGPISLDSQGPGAPTRLELRSGVAERMDIGALARVLDAAQYRGGRGDQIWRPLLSRLAYSGLSVGGAQDGTVKLDDMTIENVDARQPEKPFTAVWDRILDPATPSDRRSDLALEAVQDMYAAWRVGTMRVDGVAIAGPDEQRSFSLAALSVTGLSNQGIDSFLLKKLRAKAPEGFAALDSFELAGLVFPDLQALVKFAALQNDAGEEEHANIIRSTFAAMPRLAHIGLSGFAGGPTETAALTLAGFSLDLRGWNDFYAQGTELHLNDLEIPHVLMTLSPEAAKMMDQLGYDRLALDASFVDNWAPGPGSDEATLAVTVKDAADMEASYALTGLTTDWILRSISAAGKTEGSDAAIEAVLRDVALKSARLKLSDRSLLDRGFGFAAKKQGLTISGAAYREQMRGALPFLLSAAVPAPISKLLGAPLQTFLAGGQTLVAEIAPPTPVSLADIAGAAQSDPISLTDKLHVSVRSEPTQH